MNQNSTGGSGLKFFIVAFLSFVIGWQATSLGYLGQLNDGHGDTKNNGFLGIIGGSDDHGVDLDLFWEIWDELDNVYVDSDKVDETEKVYGAIRGLVDSYEDPYTVFMDPSETEDFNANLEGTLEGIGAELTVEDKNLVVVSPLRNSPAEEAGILPRDIIYKIDGELASEMTLFDAIMNIRGEKGTPVTLTILREEEEDPLEIEIVRDSIDLESVTVEHLDGNITYLSVNQFNDKTSTEFGKAVSDMLLDEPDGLIIDLRYNGGGYLETAVDLLSYILPSDKEAVIIKQRGVPDDVELTSGNPKILNVPLVVLVNEGSASASEIVAGAVQDHERGIIMGTQTFGKGSVQEVHSFSDNSSIRITIARWFTPHDQNIDKVGITPDIIVDFEDEDYENEYDRQKEEAVDYLLGLK